MNTRLPKPALEEGGTLSRRRLELASNAALGDPGLPLVRPDPDAGASII
jgi:hypothetical protein